MRKISIVESIWHFFLPSSYQLVISMLWLACSSNRNFEGAHG